ncbi:MAG TPA: NAD(P)/FAD-dependent oxidoreductase [Nitrososphaerales archaeon]|nr:NAD(P)/FAD-dependent oxidoreductase [Nitrososphaerales archaeon]
MKSEYDVAIIGGGHNGLVSAAYLAKQGFKVGVFEKRPIVGGAVITEELWKGFRVSRLSYAYSLFDPQIVKDLNLEANGLEVVSTDPDLFVPFPDGKHAFIWEDEKKTAEGFKKFSEKDARNYPKYLEFWKGVSELLGPMMLSPPPKLEDFTSVFETTEALEALKVLMFSSVSELLDEYFESEYVKAAICPRGLIGTMVGPKSPGSAYVLGHHVIGGSAGETGVWGYLKGGMGALSEAIAKSAISFGADLVTGAGVKNIIIRNGCAEGIELEDGSPIKSKYVLSNADPKQTFLRLVGKENLDSNFVKSVEKIKDEGCVVKLNAALEELPDFKALPGKSLSIQHRGITSIGPSVEYCERAFDDAKYGRPSDHPFLRIVFHSANDPGLAPPGKHTMSIFAQYFPYRLAKGNWDERKEEVGDNIIETLSEYAPNVKRSVIHREVLTPLDMERMFSLPRGNIFHMEITPDQMFFFRPVAGWSSYRTPIRNLYLCGSGTHPGGGVTGAPGYNAAQALIADIG